MPGEAFDADTDDLGVPFRTHRHGLLSDLQSERDDHDRLSWEYERACLKLTCEPEMDESETQKRLANWGDALWQRATELHGTGPQDRLVERFWSVIYGPGARRPSEEEIQNFWNDIETSRQEALDRIIDQGDQSASARFDFLSELTAMVEEEGDANTSTEMETAIVLLAIENLWRSEDWALQSGFRAYLLTAFAIESKHPGPVKRVLRRMASAFIDGHDMATVILARAALEVALTAAIPDELVRTNCGLPKEVPLTLNDRIRSARSLKKLSDRTIASAHWVRESGNIVAHGETEVSARAAITAIVHLMEVLKALRK
jgi:hypothetical protein